MVEAESTYGLKKTKFVYKRDIPKRLETTIKAIASRILHPFFGNFKSLARASSDIIGEPEAIRKGKNDQNTLKVMAMY